MFERVATSLELLSVLGHRSFDVAMTIICAGREAPAWGGDVVGSQVGKLRCILHYFCRVTTRMPEGKLTFHRRVVDTDISWLEAALPVLPVRICEKGLIEDADECVQADFANKVVGGGVLGRGAVQVRSTV